MKTIFLLFIIISQISIELQAFELIGIKVDSGQWKFDEKYGIFDIKSKISQSCSWSIEKSLPVLNEKNCHLDINFKEHFSDYSVVKIISEPSSRFTNLRQGVISQCSMSRTGNSVYSFYP